MVYEMRGGGRFDPNAWASFLQSAVIPNIRAGAMEAGGQDIWAPEPSPEAEQQALIQASEGLAPPKDMVGAGEMYAVLMGIVALRANTSDFVRQFPDARARYFAAAGWFCENLGELIFWNCD